MRYSIVLPGLIALVAWAGGCGDDASASGRSHRIVITGSSTVAPLVSEIGKRFESLHEGVRVDVQTGGSSRGIADVRSGLADIGMASRALTDMESDLQSYTIARDGICMIVHRSNPVASLSRQQIIDIYTGRVTRWAQVGGPDTPVTVVHKAQGRSTLQLFLKHFDLEARSVKATVIIGDNQQGIKTVAGNPDAIGYVSIGSAAYETEHGTAIKLLPMDGVAASVQTVGDATFPLSRPLNLVTRATPVGVIKQLIGFARSSQVDDLVSEQNFVAVSQ